MSSWSLIINNLGFLYFNQHKSNRKEAAAARKQLLTWSLLQSDLRLTQSLQQVQKPVTHSGYQSGQWWKQEELLLSSVSLSDERFVGSCSDPCAHWPSQLQMFADVLEDMRTSENVFHSSTQTLCMSEMKNHTLSFYGCHGNTLSDPGNK